MTYEDVMVEYDLTREDILAALFQHLTNFEQQAIRCKRFLEKARPPVQNPMVDNRIVGVSTSRRR